MVSAPAMALDTRDRAIVMPPSLPGQSDDGGSGCTQWTKTNCQKDYGTCKETCRMTCTEGDLKGYQKPMEFPIPSCSTKSPLKGTAR